MTEHEDRGSALLLMPASLLVVLVLGAIAVDLSGRFLTQREAVAAAEAAANDAAGAGLDLRRLHRGEGYALDPSAVRRIALRSLEAQGVLEDATAPPRVDLVGDDRVRVVLRVATPGVFGQIVSPTGASEVTVSATARVAVR